MKGSESGDGIPYELAPSFVLPFLSRQDEQGHYLSIPESFPIFLLVVHMLLTEEMMAYKDFFQIEVL